MIDVFCVLLFIVIVIVIVILQGSDWTRAALLWLVDWSFVCLYFAKCGELQAAPKPEETIHHHGPRGFGYMVSGSSPCRHHFQNASWFSPGWTGNHPTSHRLCPVHFGVPWKRRDATPSCPGPVCELPLFFGKSSRDPCRGKAWHVFSSCDDDAILLIRGMQIVSSNFINSVRYFINSVTSKNTVIEYLKLFVNLLRHPLRMGAARLTPRA